MDLTGLLASAGDSISVANLLVLAYVTFTVNGLVGTTKQQNRLLNKIFARVQTLSTKAGLTEIDPE